MGKNRYKYKIVKETRIDGEYGNVYTMYRVKKKILGLFWHDIGGKWTIEGAEKLINEDYLESTISNYYNGQIIPNDEVVGEYEF